MLCAIAVAAQAQESADSSSDEAYDEIEVVGKAQLDDLRNKLYESEVGVYNLFNDLNDENEFDVICLDKAPTSNSFSSFKSLKRL